MITLPSSLIPKKNTISDTGAWLILLEVIVPNVGTIRLTSNNEDVIWPTTGGNSFQAFPFEPDEIREDGKGGLPSFAIRVSNVTRVLEPYIDSTNGLVGTDVRLIVVHSDHLDETTPALDETYSVTGCSISTEWVTIKLGAENPMRKRSPKSRYLKDHCRFKPFKGTLCGYAGSATTCDRTFTRCKQLGNTARFGGFPGIGGANYV